MSLFSFTYLASLGLAGVIQTVAEFLVSELQTDISATSAEMIELKGGAFQSANSSCCVNPQRCSLSSKCVHNTRGKCPEIQVDCHSWLLHLHSTSFLLSLVSRSLRQHHGRWRILQNCVPELLHTTVMNSIPRIHCFTWGDSRRHCHIHSSAQYSGSCTLWPGGSETLLHSWLSKDWSNGLDGEWLSSLASPLHVGQLYARKTETAVTIPTPAWCQHQRTHWSVPIHVAS